jgi:hypothetical protein
MLFSAIFFLRQIVQPTEVFKQAYGLYDDIWSPVVQSAINLAFSILFVLKYGVLGVFLGTMISQFIVVMLWRPFYVFKFGFKINHFIYWKGFGLHLFYFSLAFVLYYSISKNLSINSNPDLIFYFLKIFKFSLLFSVIYFSILALFSLGFKNLIKRFIIIIRKKLR